MQRITNLFDGTVKLKIMGENVERVLNIFASAGIEVWGIKRDTGAILLTVHMSGYEKIKNLQTKGDLFETEVIKIHSAKNRLKKLQRRYVLVAGVALSLATIWVSSLFIWQINLSGNESVSAEKIFAELQNLGVGIGTYRPGISQEFVSNKMLIAIPELSWLTVNFKGSRADVMVREETPPPEIKSTEPASLYASKEGIITGVTVIRGRGTVIAGETVNKGDLLVTGDLRTDADGGMDVRAEGAVMARTWHEISAVMPLETFEKHYGSTKKTRRALIFGGKRINLYFTGGNNVPSYDKITKYNALIMPNGAVLPMTFVKEECEEHELNAVTRNADAAVLVLKARVLQRLKDEIGPGGIISTDYLVKEKDGAVTVTLFAECEEQIAVYGPVIPIDTNDISSGGL